MDKYQRGVLSTLEAGPEFLDEHPPVIRAPPMLRLRVPCECPCSSRRPYTASASDFREWLVLMTAVRGNDTTPEAEAADGSQSDTIVNVVS